MVKVFQPKKKKSAPRRNSSRGLPPVASITTAPVAIGNTIRGSLATSTAISGGVRARGRDFAFSVSASVAAANDWTLVGGFPITPAVLQSSVLRSYTQMYAKFKCHSLGVHYITSSPTSQAGDIMFYYERDRNGPMIDCTNTNFLPFVLSDPNTTIGPQWTNHTLLIKPVDEWNSTDYGMSDDLNEESTGTVFIYSKTNAASSPGYVLFDYDMSFKELSLNPRAGILPVSRGKWLTTCLGLTATATTINSSVMTVGVVGNTIGGVSAAGPSGIVAGDIYKVIADVTNSTVSGTNAAWTVATTANLFSQSLGNSAYQAVTIDDGFTFYAVAYSTSAWKLFPNLASAKADNGGFYYGVTGTLTWALCCSMSLVSTKSPISNQSSY
jgi:hypothetical protein